MAIMANRIAGPIAFRMFFAPFVVGQWRLFLDAIFFATSQPLSSDMLGSCAQLLGFAEKDQSSRSRGRVLPIAVSAKPR